MLDVKEATGIAVDFIQSLYSHDQLANALLEEVELSDDDAYWYITLGFNHVPNAIDPLEGIRFSRTPRVYKTVKIDTKTGQPRAMTNKKNVPSV